jgi:hypothetical protein
MTQTQFKRIPFDLNLAKKIMNGDIIGGRIVTQEGFEASILYVDMNRYGNTYLTVIVDDGEKEFGMFCLSDGKRADGFDDSDKGRFDLYIELPIYHKDYSNFEPCKWQPCVVRESEDYSWLVQICAEKNAIGTTLFYTAKGEKCTRAFYLPLNRITVRLIGTIMSFDELLQEMDSTYHLSDLLKFQKDTPHNETRTSNN